MDSQKNSTIWMALAVIVAIIMGIPGWAVLGLMLWFRWYPDPAKEPDMMAQAGALMTGWLPVIVVSIGSTLSAVLLLAVIRKRWKNKRLTAQIVGLNADLEGEKAKATKAIDDAKEARIEANEASLRENDLRGQRDGLSELYDKSKRELADLAWLSERANNQARDKSQHVTFTVCKYPHAGSLILDGDDHLCITLGLLIRNDSVFDITIRPEDVTGRFSFKGQPLMDPITMLVDEFRAPIENLNPIREEVLVLKQPLLRSEAETISNCLTDNTAKFWIGNLRILISVINVAQQVNPKPLRITAETEYVPLSNFKCNTKTLDRRD